MKIKNSKVQIVIENYQLLKTLKFMNVWLKDL